MTVREGPLVVLLSRWAALQWPLPQAMTVREGPLVILLSHWSALQWPFPQAMTVREGPLVVLLSYWSALQWPLPQAMTVSEGPLVWAFSQWPVEWWSSDWEWGKRWSLAFSLGLSSSPGLGPVGERGAWGTGCGLCPTSSRALAKAAHCWTQALR